MGLYRSITDRLVTRFRDEYESVALRDYFRRTYDIEIGLYSYGCFDRWRVPPGSRIGRYCSFAKSARLLDGNHPIEAMSTHPYFYDRSFGVIAEDRVTLQAPVIGDDVWIGHNAIVMPSCNHIGRGAIIGAGAVVLADVAPYAIVAGVPGKPLRSRFMPDIIALLEASQWWTLDRAALAAANRAAPDFVRRPDAASAGAFFAAIGRELPAAGA